MKISLYIPDSFEEILKENGVREDAMKSVIGEYLQYSIGNTVGMHNEEFTLYLENYPDCLDGYLEKPH